MPPYFICQVWLCILYGGPFAKIFNNWFLRPHLSNLLTGIFLAVSQVSAPGPAGPQHRAPGLGHGGHPRQVRVKSQCYQDPVTLTFSLAQIQLEAVCGSDLRYRGPWRLCPSSQRGGLPHEGGSQHQVGHGSRPPALLSTLNFWHHNEQIRSIWGDDKDSFCVTATAIEPNSLLEVNSPLQIMSLFCNNLKVVKFVSPTEKL